MRRAASCFFTMTPAFVDDDVDAAEGLHRLFDAS
jgi:hypothetical protein